MPAIDVNETTFPQEVIEASRTACVLVDFWASWCGPCKTLAPILDRLADSSGGKLKVAKVNTETEQRLAAMFQVQSIPFVVAFVGGRPVDAFAGALDEPQVRAFLERIGVDLPAGDGAEEPEQTPTDTPLGKATVLLRGRRLDEIARVHELLTEVEEDEEDFARAQRLLEAEPWFAGELGGEAPGRAEAEAARATWVAGDELAAMQALLGSVEADPRWNGELGRKALVALMQLHDDHAEAVDAMRRRLAILLY